MAKRAAETKASGGKKRPVESYHHKGKKRANNPSVGLVTPETDADATRIAMWMLDTDYDGRSLYPSQVFFPMAGAKDGCARLAKNLKAEIDEELIEAYRGTISLPFEPGNQ